MAIATRVEPPGPKTNTPLGGLRTMLAFRRDRTGFLERMHAQYGDVVRIRLGPRELYLLNHPDYVEEVLVTRSRSFVKGRGLQVARRFLGNGLLTSEGAFHLRQRRLIQPIFHRQRIAGYGETMVRYAERTGQGWQPGAVIDMSEAMMALTLAIVGKTLFDADVENDAHAVGDAMRDLFQGFSTALGPLGGLTEKLRLPAERRTRRAEARLNAIIYRLIAEHRASGDRGDLLSMLLAAQDEDDGGAMTDQQVRDEAMTLFLAGHETTANALTWTWYLLAQNPEAEARLHAEVDTVLNGRPPTVADLPRLAYTRMVLSEALRLYPPAWVTVRTATEPVELGGFVIPEGAGVFVSQWVLHRDARFWEAPLEFRPERFTPEAQAARPKFAYFPFGAGPRVCIGEPFAWMEGVLILATLARHWQPRLDPTRRPALDPVITLRPKNGVYMRLERRPAAPAGDIMSLSASA